MSSSKSSLNTSGPAWGSFLIIFVGRAPRRRSRRSGCSRPLFFAAVSRGRQHRRLSCGAGSGRLPPRSLFSPLDRLAARKRLLEQNGVSSVGSARDGAAAEPCRDAEYSLGREIAKLYELYLAQNWQSKQAELAV